MHAMNFWIIFDNLIFCIFHECGSVSSFLKLKKNEKSVYLVVVYGYGSDIIRVIFNHKHFSKNDI